MALNELLVALALAAFHQSATILLGEREVLHLQRRHLAEDILKRRR